MKICEYLKILIFFIYNLIQIESKSKGNLFKTISSNFRYHSNIDELTSIVNNSNNNKIIFENDNTTTTNNSNGNVDKLKNDTILFTNNETSLNLNTTTISNSNSNTNNSSSITNNNSSIIANQTDLTSKSSNLFSNKTENDNITTSNSSTNYKSELQVLSNKLNKTNVLNSFNQIKKKNDKINQLILNILNKKELKHIFNNTFLKDIKKILNHTNLFNLDNTPKLEILNSLLLFLYKDNKEIDHDFKKDILKTIKKINILKLKSYDQNEFNNSVNKIANYFKSNLKPNVFKDEVIYDIQYFINIILKDLIETYNLTNPRGSSLLHKIIKIEQMNYINKKDDYSCNDCINGYCFQGTCICKSGFMGKNCEENEYNCNCNDNGKCVAENKCECNEGFTGEDCSIKNECSYFNNPECLNRGNCLDGKCYCFTPYYGKFCENSMKICEDNCNGNGYCNDGECQCANKFYGRKCEKKFLNCINGEFNVDLEKCTCKDEYFGDLCQFKNCSDKCGTYEEIKNELFVKLSKSVEIKKHISGKCDYNTGKCQCVKGFAGPNCEIKKCPNNCNHRGKCINGKCNCHSNFEGDDCKYKKCHNNCYGNGECDTSSMQCFCNKGYSGRYCENKNCDVECKNNSTCINGKCICPPNFTGIDCTSSKLFN